LPFSLTGPSVVVATSAVGERVCKDTKSGATAKRPGLVEALDFVRQKDTLVVWRLDRLGRSLKDLLEIVNRLEESETGLRSVTESLDATTPGGKLIFHIFASIDEFERNLIRERTIAAERASVSRTLSSNSLL